MNWSKQARVFFPQKTFLPGVMWHSSFLDPKLQRKW